MWLSDLAAGLCCSRFNLFFNHLINLDASVGAYHGACGAADACLFVAWIGEMIASVIDLFGLEGEHVAWTGHHAEVAAFAALLLDGDGTVNFCHTVK